MSERTLWNVVDDETYIAKMFDIFGLDPNMPVSELRRALACWERVKQGDVMTYDDFGRLIVGDDWNRHLEPHMHAENGADTLLRWLIGGGS